MRDYMIAHYSKINERAIMRVSEDYVQRLSNKDERTTEKKWAKRFYHEDDAKWALVLVKVKWVKEEELKRPDIEKQSWDELSFD